MLKQRIITGTLIGLLVIGALYWMPPVGFMLGIVGLLLLMAWEWAGLLGWKKWWQRGLYGGLYLLIIAIAAQLMKTVDDFALVVELAVGIAVAWWLWALIFVIKAQRQPDKLHFRPIAFAVIGLCVLLPFGFSLLFLYGSQYASDFQFQLLTYVIAVVALSDIAAYFVGKRWGRNKLASRVSPGKTWEGVLGGALVATGCSLPLGYLLGTLVLGHGVLYLLTMVAVLVGVVGDLFESVVKRLAKVKDSGSILPGHGGLLDRLDSYTAALPIFVAGYLLL